MRPAIKTPWQIGDWCSTNEAKMKNFKSKIKTSGKIQAWLIDENEQSEKVFVQDYFSYKKNLTPDEYLSDMASLGRGLTPDMEIKYVALSGFYDPPGKLTPLEGELFRVAPTSITQVNKTIIVEALFDQTLFTKKAEIVSVTDKKTVVVASNTGFSVGERVTCKVNGAWEERRLDNISGTTFTFHANFSDLPTIGVDNCRQMISRLHLIYGSGATLSVNTGKAVSLAQLKTEKPSNKQLYTRHEIEYRGA
jgi:hypothetical protein